MYLQESGGEYDQEDLGGNFNKSKYQINIFVPKNKISRRRSNLFDITDTTL